MYGQPFNLRDYYFDNRRWILGLGAISMVGITWYRVVLGTVPLMDIQNGVTIAVSGVMMSGVIWRAPILHASIAVLTLLLAFLDLFVVQFSAVLYG